MGWVVVDACVVITFGNADALDVITRLQRHEVGVCPRVVNEVTKPPAAEALRDAVNQGIVGQLSLDLTDATERSNLQRFDSRPAFRNRADAEVLALAISRTTSLGQTRRRYAELQPKNSAGKWWRARSISWCGLYGRGALR